MGLPTPKLDDREFDDLVDEAVRRIQKLCPQWTDFNPSDPGMTLIDVMAWMTETILYRLNRVPDRNYIKFLELAGVRLKPVEPARAWVQFTISGPVERIPCGTIVSTRKRDGHDAISFETRDDLVPTTARLVRVLSGVGESLDEHTPIVDAAARATTVGRPKNPDDPLPPPTRLFARVQPAPHVLHLRDARLALGPASIVARTSLRIRIDVQTGLAGADVVEWRVWDGTTWAPIVPRSDTTRDLRATGDVELAGLAIAKRDGDAHEFRAELVGAPDVLPVVTGIRRQLVLAPVPAEKLYLATEVRLPEDVARRIESDVARVAFVELDPTHDVLPFGPRPRAGAVFYVGSMAFARPGSRAAIAFAPSSRFTATEAATAVQRGLTLVWEYSTADGGWGRLARVAPGLVEPDHQFTDETEGLTRSGTVTFAVPKDAGPLPVQGQMGTFVRVKVESGEYRDGDAAPCFAGIAVGFTDPLVEWEHVTRENYMESVDVTDALNRHVPTPAFVVEPERDPAVYLAFDAPLPKGQQRLYLSLTDEDGVAIGGPPLSGGDEPAAAFRWEYWRAGRWEPLGRVRDDTRGLSRSDAVEFIGPSDWTVATKRELSAFWLRARFVNGRAPERTCLAGAFLNAVEAEQVRTQRGEVLGSSTGAALQSFRLSVVPILPRPRVLVREEEWYSADAFARLVTAVGRDAVADVSTAEMDDNGVKRTRTTAWVRWHEVESFATSDAESRHVVVDHTLGTVSFGDGRRGRIPPAGTNNVKLESYQHSEGAKGNVGRGTITVLEASPEGVEKVINVEPAEGGADPETIEDAKVRGAATITHRDRAVTLGDFAELAVAASGQVARAFAIPQDGAVAIVVVPKSMDPTGFDPKPRPAARLVDRVLEYLDERRVLTTRVNVVAPEYEDVRLSMEVSLKRPYIADFAAIVPRIERRLSEFVHPLRGGDDGTGWEMSRALHVSELYYTIERMDEVDTVDDLKMWRWTEPAPGIAKRSPDELPPEEQLYGPPLDRIALGPHAFPFFREIHIVMGS